MVKIAHIVMIPLTGVGLGGGYGGDKWFKERIQIFKDYTLKSLKGQNNHKFYVWITMRPEEENNPLAIQLQRDLYQCFFSYQGLMYHDDKFSKGLLNRVLNLARIIRRGLRNKSVRGVVSGFKELFVDKNSDLVYRLSHVLPRLNSLLGEQDWIYLTRIDSDDMFHRDAVKEIQVIKPFKGAITCKNGYIYNALTQEVAEWNPKTNPPFHTIIFPGEVFFDPERHLAYYKGFKSHEDIPKVFETKSIGDGKYCVVTHKPENHISTGFNHPYRGKLVDKKILKSFGI